MLSIISYVCMPLSLLIMPELGTIEEHAFTLEMDFSLAGSCPPPPPGIRLWEECPLVAAAGHCGTGFALEHGVCTVNVTCDHCHMSHGG